MDLWIGAVNLGILYAFMAIGTYITYKLYSFADITIDGTFATGAAVASILIVNGWNPFLVIPVAFFVGSLAGFITGFIHTRFKIEGLLAGILVMTGLYSVNLHIMGKSNIPLLNTDTFVTMLAPFNPGLSPELWTGLFLILVIVVFWMVVSIFLKTDFGLTMQATGNNPIMVSAQGVSVNNMKIFGIAIANGFVGISGALIAQYQGFADIGMGIGSIIFSLASVIIGDAILRSRSLFVQVLGVILGSVIFRLAVALALHVGMNPNDLKLITAVFVLITLIASGSLGRSSNGSVKRFSAWLQVKNRKIYLLLALVLIIAAYLAVQRFASTPSKDEKVKIGIIMATNSGLISDTRDGFISEMEHLGYINGKNCEILEQNAEGDIPTNQTIIDHFLKEGVDIYVPISTASTQATLNKVKDKPIVFATVADPFIIGAGTSPENHPANITGIYGTSPITELLGILRTMYPGKVRIGTIYNPAYPNTVVNLGDLKKATGLDPGIELVEATVSGSNDVYQAALSLAAKKVAAYVLINDLTVFNSFESIVKVSRNAGIPIFTCDSERLKDGAMIVYGYTYKGSGMQAARLVDRILKGEHPKDIPYEKYKVLIYGVNYDLAKELKITVPEEIRNAADAWVKDGTLTKPDLILPDDSGRSREYKAAVFQFNKTLLLERTKEGFMEEIRKLTGKHGITLKMDQFDSHGDYPTGQSIAHSITTRNYDYVITFSTLAMQMMANNNTKIPHVFAAVTDPVRSGVGTSLTDHRPNLTGLATPQPVEATIKLIRELFPGAKTIGMIWNSGEVNSEICTLKAREACKKYNFRLLERTITSLNDLDDARRTLLEAGMDIFFLSGDVLVSQAIPQLSKVMTQAKIPFITNNSEDVKEGAFLSMGADYYEVGQRAAGILLALMEGADPKNIPIELYVPYAVGVNLDLARKYGIAIPDTMIQHAKITIR